MFGQEVEAAGVGINEQHHRPVCVQPFQPVMPASAYRQRRLRRTISSESLHRCASPSGPRSRPPSSELDWIDDWPLVDGSVMVGVAGAAFGLARQSDDMDVIDPRRFVARCALVESELTSRQRRTFAEGLDSEIDQRWASAMASKIRSLDIRACACCQICASPMEAVTSDTAVGN